MAAKLRHEGLEPGRQRYSVHERMFAEVWAAENDPSPGLNHGIGILDHLTLDQRAEFCGIPRYRRRRGPVTQEEATLVASVIQWLGTNCGAGFLAHVERRVQAIKADPLCCDHCGVRVIPEIYLRQRRAFFPNLERCWNCRTPLRPRLGDPNAKPPDASGLIVIGEGADG